MYCEPLETIESGNYTIELWDDEHCDFSPREADNVGIMVCFHKRYDLGDKHDYSSDNFEDWEQLADTIIKNEKPVGILPIYMYDHSGITIRTGPFSCPWDSGQIGFIYTTKKRIREFMGNDICPKNDRERIMEILESEVKEYDEYLRGEVYGYKIKDRNGNEIDSLFGIIGRDWAIKEATSHVNYLMKHEPQQLELISI